MKRGISGFDFFFMSTTIFERDLTYPTTLVNNMENTNETWLTAGIHIRGVRPEKALEAFVTPEIVNSWFTAECRCELRVGGKLYWKWSDTMEETCVITDWRPGERLAFKWSIGEGLFTECTIDAEWIDDKNATKLSLREGPFPLTAHGLKMFNEIANGWGHELLALRIFLVEGIDPRRSGVLG